MKGSSFSKESFSNRFLLLFILFLNLAGFSLIFPLFPAILDHYLGNLKGADANLGLDTWLLPFLNLLETWIPDIYLSSKRQTVFFGGILASLYSILQFLVAPYWGKLSDRIGRRPVLVFTSLGFALSFLLWFFSSSFTLFCLSRILAGIMGGNIGVASAAMADMSSQKKRLSSMGMVGAAIGAGFLFGPLIGGLSLFLNDSLEAFSSHPFSGASLLAFLLCFLSFLLSFLKLKETFSRYEPRLTPSKKVKDETFRISFFSASRRLQAPILYQALAINFIYVFLFTAYEFSFSFFYSLEFFLDPTQIGFLFFYLGVWLVLSQGYLVRVLSRRFPPSLVLRLGLALIPLPIFFFGFSSFSLILSLLILIPISIGSSLVMASLSGIVSLAVSPEEQGYALGKLRSFSSLGRALGPLATAPLYSFLGAQILYMVLGFSVLCIFFYSLGKNKFEPVDAS